MDGSLSLWRKIVWTVKGLSVGIIVGTVLGGVLFVIGSAYGIREIGAIGFFLGIILTRYYYEPQIQEEIRKKQLRQQLREEERDAQLLQEIREEEQND